MTPWNVDIQIGKSKKFFTDHSLIHELAMFQNYLHLMNTEKDLVRAHHLNQSQTDHRHQGLKRYVLLEEAQQSFMKKI